MKTLRNIDELRRQLRDWRTAGEQIALVPTMGNLHAGHLSLIDIAKARTQRVVVSIYVNPMQFNHHEEVLLYPRTFQADCEKLISKAVDVLFYPATKTIYPHGFEQTTRVELAGITEVLCGSHRPGHFTGVLTVVSKLFNLVQPDIAVFGEKDYQQLQVIRRMVEDLNYPIEILAGSTVREADGLAMSSRNNYLNLEERALAPNLFRVLQKTAQKLLLGERNFTYLEQAANMELRNAGLDPDYVSILSADGLASPDNAAVEDMIVLAAAWLGTARLIDNLLLRHYANQKKPQQHHGS